MIESLKELMAAGRIKSADPEATARLLNGAMVDAALWVAASPQPLDTLTRVQQSLASLLDGLERR